MKVVRAREDRETDESMQAAAEPIKIKLAKLYLECQELEERLKATNQACQENEAFLNDLENEIVARQLDVAEQRAHDDEQKREWFRNYRQGDITLQDVEPGPEDTDIDIPEESEQADNDASSSVGNGLGESSRAGSDEGSTSQRPHTPKPSGLPDQTGAPYGDMTGVEVHDGAGEVIGELHRLDLDNIWVDTLLNRPIERPVRIRPGKKFTAKTLESIYEPSDAKGAKWLACHIQATGTVQGQPCRTCVKNVGIFSECIVLDDPNFPRCGNCEWNRQGCHGASFEPRSRHAAASDEGITLSRPLSAKSVEKMASSSSGNTAGGKNGADELPALPKSSTRKSQHSVRNSEDEAETGAAKQHKQGKKKSLGQQTLETPQTPEAPDTPEAEDEEEMPELPEITKETLDLRDDGVVFTDPPCMKNVPLVKISPSHAYWDPEWKPIEDEVQLQLNKWLEKHDQLAKTPTSSSASKFLANRQINRGRTMLQFLEDGELHPYQIIGKQWITRGFIVYDTLYRMVQVLQELTKFKIDMKPSQWLRQRLHEIYVEKGDSFDLAKTIHHMYHDPKVSHLRIKNGFGTIGRPSGFKMREKAKSSSISKKGTPKKGTPKKGTSRKDPSKDIPGKDPSKDTPGKEAGSRKRKEPHSTPKTTPQKDKADTELAPRSSTRKTRQGSAEVPLGQPQAGKPEPGKFILSARNQHKKQRVDQNPAGRSSLGGAASLQEDLEHSGYTSTDSFSGDHVMKLDWRVYQVKTRLTTTNPAVTQYWHWVDKAEEGGESNIFEHQVLKDVVSNEVSWGVYKEPYDFHLRQSELVNVSYAPNSQKVVIATKPVQGVEHRGDVLAHFKRERTKRRFLTFMRKKGVKLVRTDA